MENRPSCGKCHKVFPREGLVLNDQGFRCSECVEDKTEAKKPEAVKSRSATLLDAVQAIRKADTGKWMMDCENGMFNCEKGKQARTELMRLLDQLYKAAGI